MNVCKNCSAENAEQARFCVQCGAALDVTVPGTEDPIVGRVLLDRFRIMRILGEGAMSRVYLAEQRIGNATRLVAVKVLKVDLAKDAQLVARFYRECETVVSLSHPNTIQFYDFGELPEGGFFIVMEYVDGPSLAEVLIAEGALDAARTIRIVLQIGSSLHDAHMHGIIHRDLKPENVVLVHRGVTRDFVKVLDFGIAKRVAGEGLAPELTQRGMVLGTPPYMAPEQFSTNVLDARSDIYSLGVMTYQMLTGSYPFEAKTPWEWATHHLTADPRPLEAYPATVLLAGHIKRAVMRALAKQPSDRANDVLEFLRELTGAPDVEAAWTAATTGELAIQTRSASFAPPRLSGHPSTPSAPMAPVQMPPRSIQESFDEPYIPQKAGGAGRVLLWLFGGMLCLAVGAAGVFFSLRTGSNVAQDGAEDAGVIALDATNTTDVDDERWFTSVHHVRNASNAQEALGAPDNTFAEVQPGGILTLEIAPDREYRSDQQPTPDLIVHVDSATQARYRVDVSADHDHFRVVEPSATTTASIDLDEKNISVARYVRITNRSPNTAVRIDAVEAPHTGPITTVSKAEPHAH